MRTILLIAILCVCCLTQCSMFEDLELLSGKDLGSIKVDIYYDDVGAPKTLYHSTDGGKSFSPIPLSYNTLEWWAVNNKNELLTVEFDAISRHVLLKRPATGSVETGYFSGSDSVLGISAGPNGEFYLIAYVSSDYKLYILSPGSSTIRPFQNLYSPADINKIWAVSHRGVTHLYYSYSYNASFYLYRSVDGGMSFIQVGTFTSDIGDIVSFNGEIYLASGEAVDSIYKSSDGTNFTIISPSPPGCTDLLAERNRIFALAAPQLYFSDNGSQWLGGPLGGSFANIDSDYTGRLYILSSSLPPNLLASDDFGITTYVLSDLPSTNVGNLAVVSYK